MTSSTNLSINFDFEEHFLIWVLLRRQQRKVTLSPFRECFRRHKYIPINLVFYMFIILISMLSSFMSYFLNRICLISCFSLGGVVLTITRTRFFVSTFPKSTSLSQWIHVRGWFILWNKAGWHGVMACRNWEFQ